MNYTLKGNCLERKEKIEYSVPALPLAITLLREESPGSIGHSASESGSYWQQ